MAVAADFEKERVMACDEMTFDHFGYFLNFFDYCLVLVGIVENHANEGTYLET